VGFAPDALARLLAYAWPGNVRELEHAIERACIFATGSEIQIDDLPEAIRCRESDGGSARARTLHRTVQGFERAHILTVLDHHHGDRRLTAAALGISLSTLKRRLRGPVHQRENSRNVQGAL
jgi:DNA-binding NtrC family response regulator